MDGYKLSTSALVADAQFMPDLWQPMDADTAARPRKHLRNGDILRNWSLCCLGVDAIAPSGIDSEIGALLRLARPLRLHSAFFALYHLCLGNTLLVLSVPLPP